KACYIPVGHTGDLFQAPTQLPKAEVLKALKPLLEDKTKTKVAHNLKYDFLVLEKEEITVQNSHDTMLMSFALYGGLHNHGLDGLCKRYFDYDTMPFKEICGTGKSQITFDKAPLDKATFYAAEDADMTLRLYHLFASDIEKSDGVKRI